MAETRQQVNIGGPRPDAVDRGQCGVSIFGSKFAERLKRKLTALDRAGDFLQRADLGRRQSEPRQARRPRAQDRGRIERIKCRSEPAPDRTGACRRKLLRDDDGGQSGEAVRPPPQQRPSGFGRQVGKARINGSERGERRVEIGFGVDVGALRSHSFNVRGRSSYRRHLRLSDRRFRDVNPVTTTSVNVHPNPAFRS